MGDLVNILQSMTLLLLLRRAGAVAGGVGWRQARRGLSCGKDLLSVAGASSDWHRVVDCLRPLVSADRFARAVEVAKHRAHGVACVIEVCSALPLTLLLAWFACLSDGLSPSSLPPMCSANRGSMILGTYRPLSGHVMALVFTMCTRFGGSHWTG